MKRKQKYCEYCGKPLTESDVEDFGTLCERCYNKEYYGSDEVYLF